MADITVSTIQDSSTSPIFRLSLEIRDQIYRQVLGNRLIHLFYESYDDAANAWRHTVCQEDSLEDPNDKKRALVGSSPRFYDSLAEAHLKCNDGMDIYFAERMQLSFLRCSRQIYNEASGTLWTTNMFSFADHVTLKQFMAARNLSQKHALQKLHLDMDWTLEYARDWSDALKLALMRSLRGLRHLRVRITEWSRDPRDPRDPDYYFLEKPPYAQLVAWKEAFQRLAILPLTNVQVAVIMAACGKREIGYWWAADHNLDLAKDIQNTLLDPKGADVRSQEQLLRRERYRKDLESGILRTGRFEDECYLCPYV